MREKIIIENISSDDAFARIIAMSKLFDPFVLLNSNKQFNINVSELYQTKYDWLAAFGKHSELISTNVGIFDSLKKYSNQSNDWIFGHLNYELYTETECIEAPLVSNSFFPIIYFFKPIYVVYFIDNCITVEYLPELANEYFINLLCEKANKPFGHAHPQKSIHLKCNVSKEAYIESIEKIKKHISRGNLYETNYCIEFYNSNVEIDPVDAYLRLNTLSPSPFSAFYKIDSNYLLCSSPERYLSKTGYRLVSQPIKGTLSSSMNTSILKNSLKERTENIMITDLVRNDLSRIAQKGTVKVDEQCGIYTFSKVHQMISTISCQVDKQIHWVDMAKETFPMGSMTGAPKIKAIEISNMFEPSARGIYSGTLGYISPDFDFDFNVVIRSIVYNQTKKYVSFHVGSAITSMSNPQSEYDECLLKAQSMLEALNAEIC